jgi:nitrate reductase NapE component
VTKPGNSDPADQPLVADDADPKAKTETTPETAPEPEPEPETEPEPERETASATEPAPEIVEMEKAPPLPAEEPVMPTAAEAARRRSELPRPLVLTIAFYLAIASAVVGAGSAILLFVSKADLIDQAQDINTARKLTAAEAERAVTSLLWLYLVVVLALGAFLVLFAYKTMDGLRRARMMALIITLIVLLFHFYFFGTALGQISGLFAAVAIALMYLPSTREYFPPRQSTR